MYDMKRIKEGRDHGYHELWVIVMCQRRFINCNRCTSGGGTDIGGGYTCGGDRGYTRNLSTFT